MRHVFYIVLSICGLLSCTSQSDAENASVTRSLQEEIKLLKSENLKKDSLVTESITYFNEIERNLSSIELNEKAIRAHFSDMKTTNPSGKEIILEKIKYINELRLENGRKMYSLQLKLDTIDVAQNEFKEVLKRLQQDIKTKDNEIAALQKILEQKDKQYAQLFSDYQQQLALNKEQEVQNNSISHRQHTVYYAVGTQKELKENNIITVRKKGFSKRFFLSEEFNESYFTPIQSNETDEITFDGKKVSMITDHPESSYQLIPEGKKIRMKIINPELFWKVSKYLVVVVD